MSRYPSCPSCGCDMQLLSGGWRCPWTSTDRHESAMVSVPGRNTQARGQSCDWPGGARDLPGVNMRR